MTTISLDTTSYRCRKLRRSLLTFLKFSWIFVFFWVFWKFPKKWKPRIGWDTALLKLRMWLLQRDSEPNTTNISLKWPAFHSNWPHIDAASSGDYFWHFWNFPEFLCFSHFFGNSDNATKKWTFFRTEKFRSKNFEKNWRQSSVRKKKKKKFQKFFFFFFFFFFWFFWKYSKNENPVKAEIQPV